MNLFEGLLLNFVFFVFPMLVYLFYFIQTNHIKGKDNQLFFDFALFTSTYLFIRFGLTRFPITTLYFLSIPVFFAYKKERLYSAFLLSMILVWVHHIYYQAPIVSFMIPYVIYFVIYIGKEKKKLKEKRMMIIFFAMNVIVSTCYLYLFHKEWSSVFIVSFSIFLLSILIMKLLEKGNELVHFHISLKELEQQKQVQDTLFKITHEIKNPIAVCKGYLDMFDPNNPEHSQKYIPIIREEIERTLVLIQDFLATSHVKIEKEEMDMNLLLEEVIHNFKPILKQNHITLDVSLEEEEYYMMGDYYRLNQVLINVLKNAIEAIEQDGVLEISTKVHQNQITIYIKDNGVGIPEENLEKMKEPFFTTKEHGTGLGVGLSIEIVKKHDGTMQYHSQVGKGTTVEMTFPLIPMSNT